MYTNDSTGKPKWQPKMTKQLMQQSQTNAQAPGFAKQHHKNSRLWAVLCLHELVQPLCANYHIDGHEFKAHLTLEFHPNGPND